jgi:fructose 1,6-bisphosphatase
VKGKANERDHEEREDEERYDDIAGAYLGPDAPVIMVGGDSL